MNSDEPKTRKRPMVKNVVAIDHANLCYRVCSACEKTLPDSSVACRYCSFSNSFNPFTSGSKRLFRVLVGICNELGKQKSLMLNRLCTNLCLLQDVLLFNKKGCKSVFGCSADEFFDFAKTYPYAATTAGRVLEGEMVTVTLSNPNNGNAQHQRVVSVGLVFNQLLGP